jgi:Zn-dependent M28 family amino/carboxypeptidase
MHRAQALMVIAAALCSRAPAQFSGESALRLTKALVDPGPRVVDTEAHRLAEQFIASQVKNYGCALREDSWTARTPLGPKAMKNILATVPGVSGRAVAITGHYDTKLMPGIHFVGANDGGSSAGLLLELARVLCGTKPRDEIVLAWLDGEEALGEWTAEDSLYGSRRLAAQWVADGTVRRVRAVINVDMIGDRDLVLMEEWNSTPWLRELVWQAAAELGYRRAFSRNPGAIEDDHLPFLRAGIPALDLIDFDYGPGNSWWHTERDTLDKLSAGSFRIVGEVLLRAIAKLGEK